MAWIYHSNDSYYCGGEEGWGRGEEGGRGLLWPQGNSKGKSHDSASCFLWPVLHIQPSSQIRCPFFLGGWFFFLPQDSCPFTLDKKVYLHSCKFWPCEWVSFLAFTIVSDIGRKYRCLCLWMTLHWEICHHLQPSRWTCSQGLAWSFPLVPCI